MHTASPVAPAVCEVILYGISAVISGAAAVEIGKTLGITWDGAAENWNKFLSDMQDKFNNPIHAKKWISITSNGGKAVMKNVYDCYTTTSGSSGGKKDDKWYFEARRNHGEIEINLDRMNKEQALKEMSHGKL